MGPAAQPSRRDRGAVWARREGVRRRVAFVPAGKKNLFLHADVLEQTRAKLGISRGVDILRIGHSALEQGIEAPVIVGGRFFRASNRPSKNAKMRRAAEILSSPRSAIQDYGAPALRLLGARQVFLGFGVNWTSMNNDISRCGFRNLRIFVIIVLTRNTPDYFARERLYCSTFVHLW